MGMLNRSAAVVTPRQPFLDWLHEADPTSRHLSLREVAYEPRIYLIPECETNQDVDEVLRDRCEEIFTEQLDGWYRDPATWPKDLRFDVFCRWFDYHHHSILIDLCDEPLIAESD
jgi:hypothetical protein